MKKLKIYLSGPMRGYPEFNFPAFDSATAVLREMGHTVISPAEEDRKKGFDEKSGKEPSQRELKKIMKRDLKHVAKCDSLVFLEDWDKSHGAVLEGCFADFIGLDLYVFEVGSYPLFPIEGLAKNLLPWPSINAEGGWTTPSLSGS